MLGRFLGVVMRVSSVVAGLFLLGMFVSVNIEVFLRYFFNKPTIWAADVTTYALIYLTFIPAAWVLSKEGHTKVEIIVDRLKPKHQHLLNAVTSVIGGCVSAGFCFFSTTLTIRAIEHGQVFAKAFLIPKWPVLIVLPIGSLLVVLQFGLRAWHHIAQARLEK